MTNSQVLQFIIEELRKSSVSWKNNKELFEIVCAPLSYGNDLYQQRKKAKESILYFFNDDENFNKKRFDKLADNILCGENQQKYAHELIDFLQTESERLYIPPIKNLEELVNAIPCKKHRENNYKNSFHNWINGHTDRINRQEIKHRLEQNFFFSPSLWNQSEYTIKQTIREGVAKFLKHRNQDFDEIDNIFQDIKKEFNLKTEFTHEEKEALRTIENISQNDVDLYIQKHSPLQKYHSQEFILEMIPLLYRKGYHTLSLNNVIEALDLHIKGHKRIKKILAHIYGTPEVGEYEKAFHILEDIHSEDDKEIIDLKTEAVSNLRRYKLNNKNIPIEEKESITYSIIKFYKRIFQFKEQYHYYPGINLAYMILLDSFIKNNFQHDNIPNKINDILKKCESSIKDEQKSENLKYRFYANITQHEFMLLKGLQTAVLELERYLEIDEENIPIQELSRTQRQMQFFLDHLDTLPYPQENKVTENIQNAIVVIDDFIEYKKTL